VPRGVNSISNNRFSILSVVWTFAFSRSLQPRKPQRATGICGGWPVYPLTPIPLLSIRSICNMLTPAFPRPERSLLAIREHMQQVDNSIKFRRSLFLLSKTLQSKKTFTPQLPVNHMGACATCSVRNVFCRNFKTPNCWICNPSEGASIAHLYTSNPSKDGVDML